MRTIAINGRFLTQPLTGVQRFGRELTCALDRRIGTGAVPEQLAGARWRIIVPRGAAPDIRLDNIAIEEHGSGAGHLWEQTALLRTARHDLLLGFGGSGPLLHPRQLVVIHDVTIFRHPESFTRSYRLAHSLLGFVLARRARIATVSRFSREELSAVFRVPAAPIRVVYNAVEHFSALEPDLTTPERLGLKDGRYFLVLGTLKPNKNVDFAIRAFQSLARRDQKLVLIGSAHPGVFKSSAIGGIENLIHAGRLSDEEVAGLARRATALVFPSLYEGFGIPPLEAMTQGCPVLAADIPPVREACGDAALYFDPRAQGTLEEAMRRILDEPSLRKDLVPKGLANAKRFSWANSAGELLDIVATMQAGSKQAVPA